MNADMPVYFVYGITLATDFRFENRLVLSSSGEPDATFECQGHPPEDFDLDTLEPFYAAGDRGDGEPSFTLFRVGDVHVIHRENIADFYLFENRIVCHLLDPEQAHMVEILLLGTVLAFWLEHRGVVALHASAVVMDGFAIAFAGLNHAGKTSLAASMFGLGHRLLTDDILAVSFGPTGSIASAGYPQMRMWPDLAEFWMGSADGLDMIHPDVDKRRVAVGDGGLGSFHAQAVPLVALYLPHVSLEADTAPVLEFLSLRDAVVWLAAVSFLGNVLEGSGLQGNRLPSLRRIAESTPCFILKYSAGLSDLPTVAAAIHEHAHQVQSKLRTSGSLRDSKT